MRKRHYLFCPGPVMVSERVRSSLLHEDICHRVPAFEDVIQNLRSSLLTVCRATEEHTILLLTGSGSAANESVISSYFSAGDEALLISNGEFGNRLKKILDIYKVNTTVLEYEWGENPRLNEIEYHVKKNPSIKAMLIVFQESSTSLINPVHDIGRIAKEYDKTYIVDCVSALGGEDIDVVRDNIDFCTSSSNKCIGSLPGVGIVCASRKKLEEMRDKSPRTAYFNLYKLYRILEEKHQTTNTPSTTMFYALDTAVKELLEEGLENRIMRYQRCAGIIRRGLGRMKLRTFLDKNDASNTITAAFLPHEIDLNVFIRQLDGKGFTIYPGKGHMRDQNMILIGNMGNVFEDACELLLKAMKETLDELLEYDSVITDVK